MNNLGNRSARNNGRIISICWFIFVALLFIIPVKRLSSQVADRSTGMLFMESVWLTTDRTFYLPGEEIGFSAIVVETDTYSPSLLSRILKVELIDNKGNRLVQREFYLDSSRVDQIIPIPSSLSSNWYYLRAYTNWMRNSQEAINNFFPVKIVNPADLVIDVGENNPQILSASVFPENENLVANRINHCAVRIRSNNGDNIETTAVLISSSNDTVSRFFTDKTGWGVFSFTPSVNSKYNVVIPGSREPIINTRIASPKTDSPYALFLVEEDSIKLSISNVKYEHVKILIHRNYTCFEYCTVDVNNGNALFSILSSVLPDGLMQVTLLAPDNTILFKRLFINNDHIGSQPEIVMERSELNPGVVHTEIMKGAKAPTGNKLANVVVTREEPFDLFDLYLPGTPGWHFSYDIPAGHLAQEGWLVANNYPDEVARSFFSFDGSGLKSRSDSLFMQIPERESLYEFLPETRGSVLSGKVMDGEGNPVGNRLIAATLLSDNNLYAGFTFPSGRFHLIFPDRTGLEDVIVCFTSKPPSDWSLLIDPQFDTTRLTIPIKRLTITDREAEYIRELDVNRQITAIYKYDEQTVINEQVNPTGQVSFFGNPDRVMLVDDYIKLSNIREILYEVVPGVTVRKRSGSYMLSLFGDPSLPIYYDPLFLLDGIPIIDFDDFLELPTDRLREIRQLNKLYIHGNAVFSGIIEFVSVNNDMAGLGLPDKSHLLSVAMPFQSLTRDISGEKMPESNIPVLGNTLYWKSFIESDIESFSFIANNNPGTYVTRVSGFNTKGQWIYNKKRITIGINTPSK